MLQLIQNNKYNLILIILFLINFAFGYPGGFSLDTYNQYQEALSNNFNQHHPPIMAALWSFFMKFTKNPAVMFGMQLMLLWGAIYNFSYNFRKNNNSKFIYIFPILAFIPIVLTNSCMIWKDTIYAICYLFIASILFKVTYSNRKISLLELIAVFIILFYGATVKYQAIFSLPIISLWISIVITKNHISFRRLRDLINTKVILSTILITMTIIGARNITNASLIKKEENKSYSWQLVKLYDLTAIAIATNNINVFPKYILDFPGFSLDRIKKYYSNKLVDPLIYNKEGPCFPWVKDEKLLNELWISWARNIIKHPIYYLKHRALLTMNLWFKKPWVILDSKNTVNPEGYKIKDTWLKRTVKSYFKFFVGVGRPIFYLIFAPFYLALGIRAYKQKATILSIPLMLMSLVALTHAVAVIFFSMASDNRYLFISTLFVIFSHPIAYLVYKSTKVNRKEDLLEKIK